MTRSSVDLPEPGRARAARSASRRRPRATTSSSAWKSPKDLVTLLTVIIRDVPSVSPARSWPSRVSSAITASSAEAAYAPARSKLRVALLDEDRQRLRLPRDLAADDADGAELADRARGRQHDAVGEAPADRRQRDAPEGLPRATRRASPRPAPARRRSRAAPAPPRGRRTAARRRPWPARCRGRENRMRMPWSASQGPNQPVAAVEQRAATRPITTGETANGRSIERVEQAPAGEAAAHEHQRGGDAEDRR